MRLSIAVNAATAHVLLTIHPPEPKTEEPPAPLDVCCVLDVSGSMGSAVNTEDAHGRAIPGAGYTNLPSALSLSRYVLQAVVANLKSVDRFSLVTFSDDSQTVFPLSYMDTDGQTRAFGEIDKCKTPSGGSNLWSGLDAGLKILSDPHRVRILLLLSDGNANYDINTDRLYDISMKRGIVVHALGVCHRPNGSLLSSLARNGGGQLAFIPNTASGVPIVGNLHANARGTFAHQTTLTVHVHWEGDRAGRLDVLGGLRHIPEREWTGVHIRLGHLLYHRARHVVLRVRNHAPLLAQHPDRPFVSASLSCVRQDGSTMAVTAIATKSLFISGSPEDYAAMVRAQVVRCELVDAVLDMKSVALNAWHSLPITRSVERLQAVKARLEENQDSELCEKLLIDFNDSLFAGLPDRLSADFARKSVLMNSAALAYMRECHVDDTVKGTHIYSLQPTTSSELVLEPPECDAHMFSWTPDAPRPTLAQELSTMIASWLPSQAKPDVPCVDGSCLISLANGLDINVSDLRPGMCVLTPRGSRAVHTVVRTLIRGNVIGLCTIGELRITPWHPIIHDEQWAFPGTLVPTQRTSCAAVYSVLLEQTKAWESNIPALCVGGIWCAPLGHGVVSGDSILQHRYLGDWDVVARDLSRLPLEDGVRHVRKSTRDGLGMVSGFA